VKVLTNAGLKIQLHPNGTAIEGEWEPVFAAIEACHQAVNAMGCPRVYTTVKINTRTDKDQTLEDKVASLQVLEAEIRMGSAHQASSTSTGCQLQKLRLQPQAQAVLHQGAEVIDQIVVGTPDGAHPIALTAHQAGALQLAELTADVRLGEAGGLDQAGHIHRSLLELTEELQARRFAEQPEKLAVLLQQLRAGHRTGGSHGERFMTMNALCVP